MPLRKNTRTPSKNNHSDKKTLESIHEYCFRRENHKNPFKREYFHRKHTRIASKRNHSEKKHDTLFTKNNSGEKKTRDSFHKITLPTTNIRIPSNEHIPTQSTRICSYINSDEKKTHDATIPPKNNHSEKKSTRIYA